MSDYSVYTRTVRQLGLGSEQIVNNSGCAFLDYQLIDISSSSSLFNYITAVYSKDHALKKLDRHFGHAIYDNNELNQHLIYTINN